MNLIKRGFRNEFNPFRDLMRLQGDLGKFFNSCLGDDKCECEYPMAGFNPDVDLKETKDNILIHADLPGIDPKEIDIKIKNNVLTIKGERKHETKKEGDNYFRLERSYGRFERSFELPADVKESEIEATFKNGVLEVTLPKKEEAKAKEISIKVS